MSRRKVLILLTKFPNTSSKVLQRLTGCGYTHASIGLDEDMNTFYSFVTKGFIVEKLTRYLKPERKPFPCMLYEIPVPEQTYREISALLSGFVENKPLLRYNRLGVVLGLLHIARKRENHYFCSQFVAEILRQGQAVQLSKDSALYFPKDFEKIREARELFRGDLLGLTKQYCIAGD